MFCVFYFIKISKFALPGVMLIYERTSKDRKKEKCRVPVSALLGFSLTPNCPSTCTLGLLLLLFVFSLIFSQKFGIIYMIIHGKISRCIFSKSVSVG